MRASKNKECRIWLRCSWLGDTVIILSSLLRYSCYEMFSHLRWLFIEGSPPASNNFVFHLNTELLDLWKIK